MQRLLRAVLGALIVASACERTTSVGAAGQHADAGADMPTAEELCVASGGSITTASCCANIVAFPDTCVIGACSCSPASSQTTMACDCPGGCFSTGVGCTTR